MSVDNDVQKSLEKFNKELDEFIAIKQKIEKNFTQNETHQKEERALQIRIAQLTTNIQMYLTAIVAFFATAIALAIFAIDVFINSLNHWWGVGAYLMGLVIVIGVCLFMISKKLIPCQKELEQLC
jgi:predicted membrane channel-forming protein YqfA (hemolysin III family)